MIDKIKNSTKDERAFLVTDPHVWLQGSFARFARMDDPCAGSSGSGSAAVGSSARNREP